MIARHRPGWHGSRPARERFNRQATACNIVQGLRVVTASNRPFACSLVNAPIVQAGTTRFGPWHPGRISVNGEHGMVYSQGLGGKIDVRPLQEQMAFRQREGGMNC